jgi:hypothetical protein
MKPCPMCSKSIPDGAWSCGCGWNEYRDIEAIEREMYGSGDNPVVAEMRAKLRTVPLGGSMKFEMRQPGEDKPE